MPTVEEVVEGKDYNFPAEVCINLLALSNLRFRFLLCLGVLFLRNRLLVKRIDGGVHLSNCRKKLSFVFGMKTIHSRSNSNVAKDALSMYFMTARRSRRGCLTTATSLLVQLKTLSPVLLAPLATMSLDDLVGTATVFLLSMRLTRSWE